MRLTAALVILGSCALVFFAGCGANQTAIGRNPVPTISSVFPQTAVAGSVTGFTLTITGSNFIGASVVQFGSTTPATTFVSSTQLTAVIPAAAIASAGTAAVTVTNPSPGGGTSSAVNFIITGGTNNSVPTIAELDPSCAPVGGGDFTLSVFGSNFVANSVVQWNGSDLPTTIANGPVLLAQVPASDIAAAGTVAVTILNPTPGGGNSNASPLTITAGGASPQSIAVDSSGRFAYVANHGCPDTFNGSVSMYAINGTTGALTSIGPPVDTGDLGSDAVVVDPSGRFAYVANDGDFDPSIGSVSTYTISATTGALTFTGTVPSPCAPPPSPGSCSPLSVAVHSSGNFVYAANEGGFAPTGISMYSINATTGALTFTGVAGSGGRAVSVAVDPTGKFAYATNNSNSSPGEANSVSMYTATTGVLTLIGTIAAGTNPVSVAVDPTGKFAYVPNSGSNDVSMYAINTTTGALTSVGSTAAGTMPVSVAVDPTGKFAYVVNSGSNDVSMYTIDTTTGALAPIGTVATGSSPTSVAVHPSGKFAYVTNSGSNTVSMYSIDTSTGVLTLIGTVGT